MPTRLVVALVAGLGALKRKKITFLDQAGAAKPGSGCLVIGHLDKGVVVTAALSLVSSSVASRVCMSRSEQADEARLRGNECAAVVTSLVSAP